MPPPKPSFALANFVLYRCLHVASAFALVFILVGCGSRTPAANKTFAPRTVSPMPAVTSEICNGIDDNLDGQVDEEFRDAEGRYIQNEHCGACNQACTTSLPHERNVACTLIDNAATCAATSCDDGFTRSNSGRCVSVSNHLCLPCTDDASCGDFVEAACTRVGGEERCSVRCSETDADLGALCPSGYACNSDGYCIPNGGSCSCGASDTFSLACIIEAPTSTSETTACLGSQTCASGSLSACSGSNEICDEVDNNCDGRIDEGFRDVRGNYVLDIHNCGRCGIDCAAIDPMAGLVCGGDPYAASCVLACPDAADGVQLGDHVDADLKAVNGCECTVTNLSDAPGALGASDASLDVNCDGADGIVLSGYYVATDGADTNPGSPTRPLRTVQHAVNLASASLTTDFPRADIFVAEGVYTEAVTMRDGVKLHGGYRRDFRSLEPASYKAEIRAPAASIFPGGAALFLEGGGAQETAIEWLTLVGVDAASAGQTAIGAIIKDPGALLRLNTLEIHAGTPGDGAPGMQGAAGQSPALGAFAGAAPRAAAEDPSHTCIASASQNVAQGGQGGQNACGGVDVSGGQGGAAVCPNVEPGSANPPRAARGQPGRALGGGSAGVGAFDGWAPLFGPVPNLCAQAVCCGLADISVPTAFVGAGGNGLPGAHGQVGAAGTGCNNALGHFSGLSWVAGTATAGSHGSGGAGGGGGGAGGGVLLTWDAACGFPDGIGGGGGGGGAGGCGGESGQPGNSGGQSIALLISSSTGQLAPITLSAVHVYASRGGRGGDGGAGGSGSTGGQGGKGGALPSNFVPDTITLAGVYAGGTGGQGGNGGPGGAGGGGCGGGSIGIWVSGLSALPNSASAWSYAVTKQQGGQAGLGGGGYTPSNGTSAGAHDVVVVP